MTIFDTPNPIPAGIHALPYQRQMFKIKTISLYRHYLLLLFTFYSASLVGQGLTVNVSQLNFGVVNELSSTSRSVIISNNLGRTVTVTEIKFYNTYGAPAFSASSSFFAIPDGGSVTLDVWFSPRHNIFHNSEMVILNDGLRGSVSVDLVGQGTYSNAYYNSCQNKSEEALKAEINSITGNGYISLIYGPARDEMFMVIDNKAVNGQGAAQNTLESIYTGSLAVGYTSRTDAQNTFLFNTEHTFPQSLFTSLEPMKSDLHHLFPTDDASNSARGDDPFGVVSNPSWSDGGSKSNGTTFEPRDIQKGRTARAMFYFVLRYENYSNFLNSQEAILRTWNSTYPPDAIDIKRNDDIYLYQHNRNPFIDYPQFIERINSLSSFSTAPLVTALDVTQDTIIYGTIAANSPTDFHLVLVNQGNTALSLSQFNLSHIGILSFTAGGNDTTLAPGESLGLDIRFVSSTTDSVRGWLSFHSNVAGQSIVNIPIYVNDLVFTRISEPELSWFFVSPNPVSDRLKLNFKQPFQGSSTISIYSGRGVIVKQIRFSEFTSTAEFDISDLSSGIYFLKYTDQMTGTILNTRMIKMK